jgi:chemotaxis signal transduction protein
MITDRAAALRREFDESFARPLAGAAPRCDHVLAIQVAGRPYAIRLEEVAGLHTGWTVLPVPGPDADLLGVAGLRGVLVPVFDLASLLGLAGSERPRWTALATGPTPVAFAFDALDGHLQVPPDQAPADRRAGGYVGGVVRVAGRAWTVLSLADLIAAVRARRTAGSPPSHRPPSTPAGAPPVAAGDAVTIEVPR